MRGLRWRTIPCSSHRLALCLRAHRERNASPAEGAAPPASSSMHHPHVLVRPFPTSRSAAAAFSAWPPSGRTAELPRGSGNVLWGCRSCNVFFRGCALGDGCSGSTGPRWAAAAAAWRHGGFVGGRGGFTAAEPLVVDGEKNGAFGCSNGGEREDDRKQVTEQKQRQPSPSNQRVKDRRQRGASPGGLSVGNLDLLNIPGVGPANLKKLLDKGLGGVAELKRLYKDKFFGKPSEKMVQFLQSSVGIIHKNHAESITTFVKGSVDEDLKEELPNSDSIPAQKKRLTFCVEGNISVGKTTFLRRIADETLELRDLVEVVPEPISKWQDVGPNHFNILDAFYAEPQRYAYTFQNYVFVTRVMQERESAGGVKPLRLMERSVFSDRMVFVRAVHEAHWMNEMEISIYDSWFDPVVSCLPGLIPDGFIYLRASPDTCHKRMLLRRRAEEGGVSVDYLRDLHEKHESWLFPFQRVSNGVLSVSQLPKNMDNSLHPDIRDRVFYLEGAHMHSSIQKVPALVLDCEPNIDFSKDIDAKREYARQVAEFFEFVKKNKESSPAETGTSGKNSNKHIVLPHEGGLWMPTSGHLPDSALKSLNFGGTMPFFSA